MALKAKNYIAISGVVLSALCAVGLIWSFCRPAVKTGPLPDPAPMASPSDTAAPVDASVKDAETPKDAGTKG